MTDPKDSDITLLLEGTYPFVRGGVSGWVHQMIRAFPQRRFAIVYLGAHREDLGEQRYELPSNVVHMECHFLLDPAPAGRVSARRGDTQAFDRVAQLHTQLQQPGACPVPDLGALVRDMLPGGRLQLEDFLHAERAWDQICEAYEQRCTDPSFVDYFWTVRNMHTPLWKLAHIANSLRATRALHAVSTGYAGFLGALAHQLHGLPLIVSEHGIYTKERQIDLLGADWIRDNRNVFQKDPTITAHLRQLWMRFFQWLGRWSYQSADTVVALFEANRLRQIADGAPAGRTRMVPNGVPVHRLAPLRAQRPDAVPQVMCLIGRVVPIKDVKTFIRAARLVCDRLPGVQVWIAGPDEEDPDYAQACYALVHSLDLQDQLQFLGFQRMTDLLPRIGVNVLSSISEGLPLVLIEGFAAGVPAVATDVGACRQLIEGLTVDDQALGHAGAVVPIADPAALADAIVPLLADPARWHAASAAAVARVERHYTEEQMIDSYRQVYDHTLEANR